MSFQRVIPYLLVVLIFFASRTACSAQGNAWLQSSWNGRAFILGDNPHSYDVVLTVNKVKGKDFEGVLRTIKSDNPKEDLYTKVSGVLHDQYLLINIGPWKVDCSTCKPQTLALSIESGKLFLKGEAKGCSVECTWITVFSKDIKEFEPVVQKDLIASVQEIKPAGPDTVALEANVHLHSPDPVAATPPKENPPPAQRIPVLQAGGIVLLSHNISLPAAQKQTGNLRKAPSMTIKENSPTVQHMALPPGSVTLSSHNTSKLAFKVPNDLRKTPSMAIRESSPPIQHVALAAGSVAVLDHNKTGKVQENPPGSLEKTSGMTLKESPPAERISILPAGSVVAISRQKINTQASQPLALQRTPGLHIRENPAPAKAHPALVSTAVAVHKDSAVIKQDAPVASALPEGYSERKINVVKTIRVDTDSIELRVYDNGIVDGDIVSVIYNDEVVIDKLSLKSKAVVIRIPVNKGTINKLVFHAHNLGEFPPNTAKLEVLYGNKREELTISSDYTISSAIDIEYGK
jgi:hypothetical protein